MPKSRAELKILIPILIISAEKIRQNGHNVSGSIALAFMALI
jgi:hypothetical protein